MKVIDSRKWLLGAPPLVALFVVLLLIVAAVLPFYPRIENWLFVQLVGPEIQREFAFTSAIVEKSWEKGNFSVYVLAEVSPTGRLGVAGFKSGDIPLGYKHGVEWAFLDDLDSVRQGRTVEFRVVSEQHLFDKPMPERVIQMGPLAPRS